jgi:hypothetical protein
MTEELKGNAIVVQGEAVELAELATKIKSAEKRIWNGFHATLACVRDCGDILIRAKALVRHGQWEWWVEKNCNMALRTCQDYMVIASRWDLLQEKIAEMTKTRAPAFLTITKALTFIRDEDKKLQKREALTSIPCPTCGQGFDLPVWHCLPCGEHMAAGQACPTCGEKDPQAGAPALGGESPQSGGPTAVSQPALPSGASIKPTQPESSPRTSSPQQPMPAKPSTSPTVVTSLGRISGRRRSIYQQGPPEDAAGNPARVTDARGVPLTPALQDAFNDLHLPEAIRCFKEGAKHVNQAAKRNPWVRPYDLLEYPLDTLIAALQVRKPFVVHQGCQGKGCINCMNAGYLSEEEVEYLRSNGGSENEAEYLDDQPMPVDDPGVSGSDLDQVQAGDRFSVSGEKGEIFSPPCNGEASDMVICSTSGENIPPPPPCNAETVPHPESVSRDSSSDSGDFLPFQSEMKRSVTVTDSDEEDSELI